MIPGLAIAMRVLATIWFALALSWAGANAWQHATVTAMFGVGCFAYGEWLDRRQTTATRPT